MIRDKVLGWHFLTKDRKLGYGDGRIVRPGETYSVNYPERSFRKPSSCESGMHASIRIMDALVYAPGSIICRVELMNPEYDSDKMVSRSRKVLWMLDAEKLLHHFACDCAEKALNDVPTEPDPRSVEAIRVKRLWIDGSATNDELDAARSASWSAAGSAAGSAARSAAESEQNIRLVKMVVKQYKGGI